MHSQRNSEPKTWPEGKRKNGEIRTNKCPEGKGEGNRPNRKREEIKQRKIEEKGQREKNRQKESGEDSRRMLRIGSWNVCGFATDDRKRIKIT